jgi:hypothetical protein
MAPPFLTSAIRVGVGKWSALRPGRFASRKIAYDDHCVRRMWAPEAVLTLWSREKTRATAENRALDVQPLARYIN